MGARTKPACSERLTRAFTCGGKASGQAVVEMVLILPILLLLVVGALEFGRLFFTKIALTNAAREGAYYLSLHPEDKTNCSGSECFQTTRQAVTDEANNSGLTISCITICDSCNSGADVKVTAQATVNNMLLLSWLDGGGHLDGTRGSMTVTSEVEMLKQ